MSMNEPIKDMKDENEFDTNWNRSQSGVANAANGIIIHFACNLA